MIFWFGDEALSFRSEVVQNDQIQHFIPVLLSKIEFCGVQKQNAKLVFSKSEVFHIWHIAVSSAAQRQTVVNFHKLVCS